jgi:hypothetical protein
VGNKTDLAEKRKVTREEAEERAKKLKVIYVETRLRAIRVRVRPN